MSVLGRRYTNLSIMIAGATKGEHFMQEQKVQPDVCSRLNIRTLTPEDIFVLMSFESMRTCYDFINREADRGSFIVKHTGRLLRIDEESFIKWYHDGQ